MSKSKKNTVDPEPIVDRYGADAVRWFMLSDSPPERDLPWSEAGIEGAGASSSGCGGCSAERQRRRRAATWRSTASCIARSPGIAADIEALPFNKAVAKLYELANAIEKAAPSASRDAAIAHAAAAGRADGAAPGRGSLGRGRRHDGLIADAAWPEVDPALLVDDEVTIAMQVNGKLRDTLTVPKGTAARDASKRAALASDECGADAGRQDARRR